MLVPPLTQIIRVGAAHGFVVDQIQQLISTTLRRSRPLDLMCPVLVSRPRLLTVVALHQSSPLVSLFVIRAEVIILNTDSLEQQHRYPNRVVPIQPVCPRHHV